MYAKNLKIIQIKKLTKRFNKLITQLGSLLLITIAGPLIVFFLFIRQGNL